jgi:monoamine oxidase
MSEHKTHFDVIIVGAGAAGIAAGRALARIGVSFLLLEARDRTGGRAVTADFNTHPVDLGAHWIHAGSINPVVPIARDTGFALTRARYEFSAWRNGAPLGRLARWGLDSAWDRSEARILEAAEGIEAGRPDISVRDTIGNVGPWTGAASFMHGNYDCGSDPALLSAQDFARVDDGLDLLVEGGLGGLITGLARDLPIQLGQRVTQITQTSDSVALNCAGGATFSARALILTVPLMVLQSDDLAFTPPLPERLAGAIRQFHSAAYEHVVLRSSNPPWGTVPNRIVLSMVGGEHIVLFANMDGTDLHYLDMVGAAGRTLAGLPEDERASQALATLIRHFGPDVSSRARILHVTQWASDPLARGAWALANVGAAEQRDVLREPFGRVMLAGEACSQGQWGTVGGAWAEGERAAHQAVDVVRSGLSFQAIV